MTHRERDVSFFFFFYKAAFRATDVTERIQQEDAGDGVEISHTANRHKSLRVSRLTAKRARACRAALRVNANRTRAAVSIMTRQNAGLLR